MTLEEQKKVIMPEAVASEPSPPSKEEKSDDSKAIVLVVAAKEPTEDKKVGSVHRDAVLVRLEQDKRISLIKAWEEAEKSKVENKAQKKISSVGAWENSKKASVEAELKKIEQMKNKIAQIHKEAEEKRAMTEAKRGEDVLKAEEMAAKYRATGTAPTKLFGFF
ncbi:unnamed protein product [Arabidopsis thaliana]|uniref:(thale cress) hypothetical protein n=1 Tax=Arabidopsis thaliana TaxID=3702 RepID=A0A7G2EPU0_ARATH|nr:unnamed protein product [Arabidopsis thaliana]